MPTLIVWGAEDKLIPVAAARAWVKSNPEFTADYLPGNRILSDGRSARKISS
jgi:hypothetical protein